MLMVQEAAVTLSELIREDSRIEDIAEHLDKLHHNTLAIA